MAFKSDGIAIIMVFIGIIIAATFMISIANQTTLMTTASYIVTNSTVTAPVVNGSLELTGRSLVSAISIYNATNFTQGNLNNLGLNFVTRLGTDGLSSVFLIVNDTGSTFASRSVNVSYTYVPDGSVTNVGGAAPITNLIVIISALAIVLFIIVYFIKDGPLMEWIKGKL